jgi:tetratricopeptide (TPR) repeat protein
LNNRPLLAESYGRLSYTCWFLGEYDQALAYSAEGARIAQESKNAEAQSICLSSVGPVLFDRGDLQKALEAMEEATALGYSVDAVTAVGGTQAELGFLRVWLGAPVSEGMALAIQARDWLEQRIAQVIGFALVPLARMYLLAGDLDATQATLAELGTVAYQQHRVGFIAHVWIGFCLVAAELSLRKGQPAEALTTAQSARADMDRAGLRYFLPDIQLLETEALASLGRADEALVAAGVAEQTAVMLGSQRILWEILAVQAELTATQGDAEAAATYGRRAWQVVDQMAATLDAADMRDSFRRQVIRRRPVLGYYSLSDS